eukprot:scaffold253315_cov35-Tisochrysis_lutea.AAC.4
MCRLCVAPLLWTKGCLVGTRSAEHLEQPPPSHIIELFKAGHGLDRHWRLGALHGPHTERVIEQRGAQVAKPFAMKAACPGEHPQCVALVEPAG